MDIKQAVKRDLIKDLGLEIDTLNINIHTYRKLIVEVQDDIFKLKFERMKLVERIKMYQDKIDKLTFSQVVTKLINRTVDNNDSVIRCAQRLIEINDQYIMLRKHKEQLVVKQTLMKRKRARIHQLIQTIRDLSEK